MNENFLKLKERVRDSLNDSDTEFINYELSKLEGPLLVSGVGGSSVVAYYVAKVLAKKNRIITKSIEPRDINYLNLELYKSIIVCSYSGNNHGVTIALNNNLNHYLLSNGKKDNVVNLNYVCNDKENSFISLASTLIPCSILLNYYLNNQKDIIYDCFKEYFFDFDISCDAYEIFTGIDTEVASRFIETTMVESGIGIPIIHDKYAYCHGRSTISKYKDNIAIFLNSGMELDNLLIQELPKYYKNVIVLDKEDLEYKLLIKCMYLCRYIAMKQKVDLSKVDYSPIVKKLYYFKGML